jgi:hypothetical protein
MQLLIPLGHITIVYPALNEAMRAEVQRLKHSIGEISDPHAPNGAHLHMGCQMPSQQLLQLQEQPSEGQMALQQQPLEETS